MYTFFEGNNDVVNEFSYLMKEGHLFQTSYWNELKKDWTGVTFYGEDKGKKVVLSCCLLRRKIPYLNREIGYIPRGFVCDYSNRELVKSFIEYLREYAKNNHLAFITIDPEINLSVNGEKVEFGEELEEFFMELGLKNLSKGSVNFETIQPNFTFKIDISKEESETIEDTKNRIYKSMHSKCRYNVKLGAERSLSVEVYNKESIKEEHYDVFYNLMKTTGERDGFIIRNREYFKAIIETLYPYADMYLIKYSPKEDRENAKIKMNQLVNQKNTITEKIAKLKEEILQVKNSDMDENQKEKKLSKLDRKLTTSENKKNTLETQVNNLLERIKCLEGYEEDIYLSGAIYTYFGDKGCYLYGASSNEFRDAMPNFTMQWEMIQRSVELEKNVYDFWGAPGDDSEENHLHGLYKFKKSFGGDFIEYIGEYDIVIDNFIYVLFKKAFPKFKKIRGKLKNK